MEKQIKVPAIGSVKYKKQFYNHGDIIPVFPSDVESLIEDGVIRRDDVPEFDEDEPDVPLEEMKLPALKKYAKEHSIDLGEATKTADVLEVILKAGEANGDGGAR